MRISWDSRVAKVCNQVAITYPFTPFFPGKNNGQRSIRKKFHEGRWMAIPFLGQNWYNDKFFGNL
ncbi:MAG: hypothetical protein C4563_11535 [Desulfobulbus sp.]|nr:MAG: hypothetical protein C4563_11535 [Desulfobulbus sp.]